MKFRAKVFLAILLPASALVAASVGTVLVKITRNAEADAGQDLNRTRTAFEHILGEQLTQLRSLSKPFEGARFDAAVSEADTSGDVKTVQELLDYQFQLVGILPEYYELRGKSGKILLRKCVIPEVSRADPGPAQKWGANQLWAVTEFGQRPFFAMRFEPERGTMFIGRDLMPVLANITENLGMDLALVGPSGVIYSSLPGWTVASGGEGTIYVQGTRYLAASRKPPNFELSYISFIKSMKKVDEARREIFIYGTAGLGVAVLAAMLVSMMVSRGVSKPVEALVEAARKVAQGDYRVQVQIGTRDEIGKLGGAFNEMTEGLRKRQEIMDKTLSRDVAEEFLKGTDRRPERRVVTIVFMDIRGYTSGTEGMDPADVVVMLNELMDLLSGAIVRHGGIVNKFLGDGLMAMFGAPKPLEGHALRAVKAGLEMQKWMARWNDRRIARGLHSFFSGIGINTGQAMCGKVGAQDRMEYTLIGEEVNLASRICGKAAPRQVLVTKQTWELVKDSIKGRELEPVQVKGLSYPIKVYEVLE